jgi:peptidoglycan/xylan/chitin deacetylase (PgdA/CDA1 family)
MVSSGSPTALMPEPSKTYLLITIDVESDDLWARRSEITLDNIRYVPRLHDFFKGFGVRPTYLVSYPVATSQLGHQVFQPIARSGTAEIGSHMHVWTTPPIVPVSQDDHAYCPLATEISYELLREKMESVTAACAELGGRPPRSHRAGRWGFDATGLRVLEELGYSVDTSVTPLRNWFEPSQTGGTRGPDFSLAPFHPYFPDHDDVVRPGASTVLEVPVSIFLTRPLPTRIAYWLARQPRNNNFVRLLRWGGVVRHGWLSPGRETNKNRLIGIARALMSVGISFLNIMFHSSEMAPGTSPDTRSQVDVEESYEQLRALLQYLTHKVGTEAATLSEFAEHYKRAQGVTQS